MILEITNGIIFRIHLLLFMCTSLFINAGHIQRTVVWRPKGAVSIPKESCIFMGSNINDKSKTTLWALMGSFVVRSEKNKWRKVSPDCTDELVRSMDSKKMEAFARAQGKFLITQLNDGSYFVRGAIPGKGGLGPAKWIGKTIPWAITGTLIWMGWVDARATITNSIPNAAVRAVASGAMQVGFVYASPNLIPGVEESGKLIITGVSATLQQIAKDLPRISIASREVNGATATLLMEAGAGTPFIFQATAIASEFLGMIGEACPWF